MAGEEDGQLGKAERASPLPPTCPGGGVDGRRLHSCVSAGLGYTAAQLDAGYRPTRAASAPSRRVRAWGRRRRRDAGGAGAAQDILWLQRVPRRAGAAARGRVPVEHLPVDGPLALPGVPARGTVQTDQRWPTRNTRRRRSALQ